MSKMTSLIETISILLEDACCADCIEDAQEYIEKAKELNDKALEKMEELDKCCKKACKASNDDDKSEAMLESIDTLLNLALLSESADDADKYIKMAEELQKDIDDIPEEDPIVDDEYPDYVSGGEGRADDYLEDIKDLIGDDPKALELLTKDPNTLTLD